MIIDTHCHLLSCEYDNIDKEITKALSYADKIIINGFNIESSIEAVELSNKYENVYAAVGIGPENIDNITEFEIKKIESLAKNKKVVAIGEIGLDYYWTKENKERQIFIFEEMLKIARNSNLPVIVHSREAINDTYELCKKYNIKGILHCYSGSLESAKEFIKIGFLIGIGGIVTFKNAKKLKNIVKNLDLCSFSLETDSPYLTPEPYRGSKNNPCYLEYIIKEIAKIKGVLEEEVIKETSSSVLAQFDLR